MRQTAILLAAIAGLPAPALAHVGHLGEVAGHDHWIAGAAIGAAVVIGLYGAWKGRKAPAPDQGADEAAKSADDEKETA